MEGNSQPLKKVSGNQHALDIAPGRTGEKVKGGGLTLQAKALGQGIKPTQSVSQSVSTKLGWRFGL